MRAAGPFSYRLRVWVIEPSSPLSAAAVCEHPLGRELFRTRSAEVSETSGPALHRGSVPETGPNRLRDRDVLNGDPGEIRDRYLVGVRASGMPPAEDGSEFDRYVLFHDP